MPAKKKQSKLRRVLKALTPNTKPKQLLMFLLVFGVFGGGYYLYKSYAAYYPSSGYTTHKFFEYSKTPRGSVSCLNTAFRTGLGTIVYNCVLSTKTSSGAYNGTRYVGQYIVETREFQKTGPSTTNSSYDARDRVYKCSNMDNYFAGTGYTVNGSWVFYGYIYSWYGASIAKPATFNGTTYKCTPSGDWQRIYTWQG